MERRAGRWRLPLAVRIAAIPVLVALAGALAFGFIQSNAAPAAHPSWGTTIKLSSPRPPAQGMPVFSSRGADMYTQISVKSSQTCSIGKCDDIRGTVRIWVQMEGKPRGTQFSVPINSTGGYNSASVSVKIPGSELTTPGLGFLIFDFNSGEFGPSSEGERLKVRDKYSGLFNLTQSSDTSYPGEKVNFTATYAGGDSVPDSPTGKLQLLANTGSSEPKPVADGTINVTGKTVTFSSTKLPAGTRYVGWTYSGDSKFDSETYKSIAHTVKEGVATTTTLTVSPNPVVSGATLHVKMTVTAKSGSAVPTGRFVIHTGGGSTGEGNLRPDGTYEDDLGPAGSGERVFFAEYLPTGNFAPSRSADIKVTVLKGDTITKVTAQPEAAAPGKPVTLSVEVSGVPGRHAIPAGSVSFSDGDTKLGGCALNVVKCDISTDKLAVGVHTVTARYSGDDSNNPSTGTVKVRVSVGSTTKLTVAPNPATVGSAVALTAQVAGADPKITTPVSGKVTFLNGTTELGKADVDKDGKATFSASGLAVGTHNLTARFEGSDTVDPSTSDKVAVQVNAAGMPGQGGGSQGGSQGGSSSGGTGGTGGSNPQPKNLASTGADIGAPLWGGAALVILGAVALTLGRRRRVRKSR